MFKISHLAPFAGFQNNTAPLTSAISQLAPFANVQNITFSSLCRISK